MATLILKLNATGDVLRTTPLLRVLDGPIVWITASRNLPLLTGIHPNLIPLTWEQREEALDRRYGLLVNLEDEKDVAEYSERVSYDRRFGALLKPSGEVGYTDDSKAWFDMSLISQYGRANADERKLRNRRTYQELIFEGLGYTFRGEKYLLPRATRTDLRGDVAIAAASGPVWPMKKWAFFDQLQTHLERQGYVVNVLPHRNSLLEHLGDIANHRCLVGGDSLPMHLALGLGIPCVSIFNCTSPWEIYDYGIQTKLVSPLLEEYFYKRGMDERATRAISLQDVCNATIPLLQQR